MRTGSPEFRRLGDYTSAPLEILIAASTLLPFCALAYFYDDLPRVPVFMSFSGEPLVWAEKSPLSVFRVPLMALDTQLICLLAKYGTLKSEGEASAESGAGAGEYLDLSARLWDWLRCAAAFKMCAASLDAIFFGLERFRFLARPSFAFTAFAALVGAAGAIYYASRLLALRRASEGRPAGAARRGPVDARHVYGGVLYFNPADGAPFVRGYVLNFGNKWAWALLASLGAYPLLVFLPS